MGGFSFFFLAIFYSLLTFAEFQSLSGLNRDQLAQVFEQESKKSQQKLGKQCLLTSLSDFEQSQNQITDPDLKMSDEEFKNYIEKNSLGYVQEFSSAPPPSANTCFLNKKEYYALTNYTGSFYSSINQALRSQSKIALEKFRVFIKFLESALKKLKPFQGFVRRGTNIGGELLTKHKEGTEIVYTGYTSTSVKNGFSGAVSYVISISKNCKYIAPFSKYATEEEVLCAFGTRFKIHYRSDINGKTSLLMEEIGADFENIDKYLLTLH